jgi:hypothetical protein
MPRGVGHSAVLWMGNFCKGSRKVLAVASTERQLASQFRTNSLHRKDGKEVPIG